MKDAEGSRLDQAGRSEGLTATLEMRTHRNQLHGRRAALQGPIAPEGQRPWEGVQRPQGTGERLHGSRRLPSPPPAPQKKKARTRSTRFAIVSNVRSSRVVTSVGGSGGWRVGWAKHREDQGKLLHGS